MYDTATVHIFKRQTYLDKPIENLSLREKLIIINFPFDVVTKISDFTIFHYNDEHF